MTTDEQLTALAARVAEIEHLIAKVPAVVEARKHIEQEKIYALAREIRSKSPAEALAALDALSFVDRQRVVPAMGGDIVELAVGCDDEALRRRITSAIPDSDTRLWVTVRRAAKEGTVPHYVEVVPTARSIGDMRPEYGVHSVEVKAEAVTMLRAMGLRVEPERRSWYCYIPRIASMLRVRADAWREIQRMSPRIREGLEKGYLSVKDCTPEMDITVMYGAAQSKRDLNSNPTILKSEDNPYTILR